MAELKTQPTSRSVEAFLKSIKDERKQQDARKILDIMKKITKAEPKMWGPSMIGFGTYHYKYASGREGDWFLTGFSPRKQNLSLYIMSGYKGLDDLMRKLGKYRTGKSCLYINRLEDVDLKILQEIIKVSVQRMKKR